MVMSVPEIRHPARCAGRSGNQGAACFGSNFGWAIGAGPPLPVGYKLDAW